MGGTVGTLVVLAVVAAQLSGWRAVRSMEQDSRAATVMVSPLPDSGTLPETAGDSLSVKGWTFGLPGDKVVSQQALGSATSADLDDGTRVVVFAGGAPAMTYEALKQTLETPLRRPALWSSRHALDDQRELLMRKMSAAGTAEAIHPLEFGKVRGFEFVGVGAHNAERLELFDSRDRAVTLLIRPGSRATQRWINTFVGSVQPPA